LMSEFEMAIVVHLLMPRYFLAFAMPLLDSGDAATLLKKDPDQNCRKRAVCASY
jgi:hypothetical protein